ncbi:MAG: flagellin [Acetobacteraceae bacterium]|nr:flagellin [Acetobacteraceae bacterium]
MIVGDLASRLERDAAPLRQALQTLTRQLSTGQRAETPGDMAPELPRAITLRTELARREVYGTAIGQAQQRVAAVQTVLTRLTAIGREFAEEVALKLDPNAPGELSVVAERARQALVEVGQLLNTRHAGEYLFGGSDFLNPPIPDPDGLPAGAWATQIAAAVGGLGGGTAATVAAATRAAVQDDSTGVTPFSGFVSDPASGLAEPRRSVPSEDGVLLPFGLFANRNAAVTSAGETAGGWSRDLMRGLMSLAALTPAQVADRGDFQDFAVTIREGLRSATAALGNEAGALGQTQARLDAAVARHEGIGLTLTRQISSIQEVDLAATLSRLQQTQTQLEASYGAIARLGTLSLAQFLR